MAIFKRNPKKSSPKEISKLKKRGVRFVAKDEIDHVERLENKDDIWFSTMFLRECKARDMKMGMFLQTFDPAEVEIKLGESPRGLEHEIEQCRQAIAHRRLCSVAAVVGTQQRFHQTGGEDRGDSIARAYSAVCNPAVELALMKAEMDQKFVSDHVRVVELESRTIEKRDTRPAVLGRQTARRTLANMESEHRSNRQ